MLLEKFSDMLVAGLPNRNCPGINSVIVKSLPLCHILAAQGTTKKKCAINSECLSPDDIYDHNHRCLTDDHDDDIARQ